jgi:hypothetical protein
VYEDADAWNASADMLDHLQEMFFIFVINL